MNDNSKKQYKKIKQKTTSRGDGINSSPVNNYLACRLITWPLLMIIDYDNKYAEIYKAKTSCQH